MDMGENSRQCKRDSVLDCGSLCRFDIADSSREGGRGLPLSKTLRKIKHLVLSVSIVFIRG